MKTIVKKYPVTICLSAICIVFAVLTTIDYSMYNIFAYWSQPKYFWQYFSGVFMHGSSSAPVWYLWVHLMLNMLMIIPLGAVVEREIGSFKIFILFLVAWMVSSFIFKLCFWNVQETATGISAIGFAFAPLAFYCVFHKSKRINRKNAAYALLLTAMIIMICPLITGWISFYLHFSGVVIGCVFLMAYHRGIEAKRV